MTTLTKIDKQIEICFKSLEKLFKFLGIIGSAFMVIVGMYSFITDVFGILILQTVLAVTTIIIGIILTLIYDKFGTIKKLNLSRKDM